MEVLRLTLDDDIELECYVLGIFEVRDKDYIALLPVDDEKVLLYEYCENDAGPELINIEDEEVFELVVKAFEEVINCN
ncbi:MAG: DUF1292 domain-containing protein [Halanaerobiales bacterium]|nr:DUF1292 domain-containing protein [Halanaerobiales bacterium]